MIRRATFHDISRVRELIFDMHAASKYRGRVDVSKQALDEVTAQALTNQNRYGAGGTFFHVAEQGGRVEAFMIGTLSRVKLIGKALVAQDLFLHATPQAGKFDPAKLVRAYVEWARENKWVLEVNASWDDTMPGAEKVEALYLRLGFKRSGGIYSMALDVGQTGAAAA